jgi:hypothetical protein
MIKAIFSLLQQLKSHIVLVIHALLHLLLDILVILSGKLVHLQFKPWHYLWMTCKIWFF